MFYLLLTSATFVLQRYFIVGWLTVSFHIFLLFNLNLLWHI